MTKYILCIAYVCDVTGAMANLVLDIITLWHLVSATRGIELDFWKSNKKIGKDLLPISSLAEIGVISGIYALLQ